MATGKTKTIAKIPHTDIIQEIEQHLAAGFSKLKEALGEKKIRNRFKKVVKLLSKGLGGDKPKKKKSASKAPKAATAAKPNKTIKKAVKKTVKKAAKKAPAKKAAEKKAANPAKK